METSINDNAPTVNESASPLFEQTTPAPQKNRFAQLPLWIGICLCALTLAAIYGRAHADDNKAERKALQVVTTRVNLESNYQVLQHYSGRVEPRQQIAVASELAGKIAKILVEEGDAVAAGAILVELDSALLDAEKAQLAARQKGVEAELELANIRLQRQQKLQNRGFSAEDTIDELSTLISSLRSQLATLGTQIDQVDIRLQKSIITAPFDGRVQSRLADSGAVINAGTPLLELFEDAAVEIKVGVPANIAQQIVVNGEYPVLLFGQSMQAKVISLAPAVDQSTQTVPVRLRLSGLDRNGQFQHLKFGEYISLSVPVDIEQSGFWLPNTALVEGERGLWSVYAIDGESRVSKHAVEIQFTDNQRVYVTANLTSDSRIISKGVNRIAPGMLVSE